MSPRSLRESLAAALHGDFDDASAADAVPTVLGAGSDDLARGRAWLGALADEGWAVPTWPVEYGGRGAAPSEVTEISRELARYHQPDLYPYLVGLHVVGPTLLAVATPEQCARWLPAIRTGEEIWCQLFSEPGAGSDLANLSTRAERIGVGRRGRPTPEEAPFTATTSGDGDGWRLTGQKVWSSRAHYARWGFCLARSNVDVTKHAGVTAFAVDMTLPGVDVRPLRQMNGDAHFNEVFLDAVFVPDGDRIADVGVGWSVARTALANERGAVGAVSTGMSGPTERLLELARARRVDASRRDGVVTAHVAAEVARLTMRRARDRARAGVPGPEGSGAKLRSSALLKSTADVALSLLGADAAVGDGEWQTLFLMSPSISIRGGTDEIQRNIVGERVLGLPPEPRVDTDRPYRDIPH